MAFVRVGGTASLSPLNYILIRETSRPNPEGRRSELRNETIASPAAHVKSPRNSFRAAVSWGSSPKLTSFKQVVQWGGQWIMWSERSGGHLINFISCVNHDGLTFIVQLMGWSSGLGDSSLCDKCCYLLRARINRVCARDGRGRVETKERGVLGTGQSHRGCCAPTNVGSREDDTSASCPHFNKSVFRIFNDEGNSWRSVASWTFNAITWFFFFLLALSKCKNIN